MKDKLLEQPSPKTPWPNPTKSCSSPSCHWEEAYGKLRDNYLSALKEIAELKGKIERLTYKLKDYGEP